MAHVFDDGLRARHLDVLVEQVDGLAHHLAELDARAFRPRGAREVQQTLDDAAALLGLPDDPPHVLLVHLEIDRARGLEAGIFEPYDSPALADIPDEFKLDPKKSLLPVDYGDVCINYDKAYFASKDLAVPASLEDLAKPEYKGLLVVENPATSSPGLAFLAATVKHFGEDGYAGYWKQLRQNGVVVVDGWETAYYTNFSASSGKGPQPMVVSYASSPAAEVIFAEKPPKDAPTASILAPDTCFRQVEFAGVLKGAKQPELARKFIDFMLGLDFQQDMPTQMFVYPVNQKAVLPEAFIKYAQVADQPATFEPSVIAANREVWINAWTEAVLK